MAAGMGGYGGIIGGGMAATGAIANMLPGQRFDPSKARIKARKKFSTEWRENRGELDLLNQARNQNEAAAGDLNSLYPSLYQMAGFEGGFADTTQNSRRVTDAQAAVDAAQARVAGRPKGKKAGAKGKLKAAQDKLKKEQDSVARPATQIQNARYVGLGDENDKAIDAALSARVRNAAETGQSNDPRLNRELNEQTAALEAGLSARGLTGSSLGATAMGTDAQRRSESLADFARRDITEFNPLRLQQRETLADIAGKNMDLALRPMKARIGMGEAMGGTAGRFGSAAKRYQDERIRQAELSFEAEKFRSQNTWGSSMMKAGAAVAGGSMMDSPSTPAARGESDYADAMARNERARTGNSSWFDSGMGRTISDFFR